MADYLSRMPRKICLMDVELVDRLCRASRTVSYDLRGLFDGTLVGTMPVNAVTFVENHDTQPYQALGPEVLEWFKPMAYALVLLRREGYPCVFYGDLYGISGPDQFRVPPTCGGFLPDFILARKLFAYGEEISYFDYPTCVGWVRQGTWDHKDGCAIVLSNAGAGWKNMLVGQLHHGEVWTDVVKIEWVRNLTVAWLEQYKSGHWGGRLWRVSLQSNVCQCLRQRWGRWQGIVWHFV